MSDEGRARLRLFVGRGFIGPQQARSLLQRNHFLALGLFIMPAAVAALLLALGALTNFSGADGFPFSYRTGLVALALWFSEGALKKRLESRILEGAETVLVREDLYDGRAAALAIAVAGFLVGWELILSGVVEAGLNLAVVVLASLVVSGGLALAVLDIVERIWVGGAQ